MTVQVMELFVKDVEAKEAHFGNRNFLFVLVAIDVAMAVGVLLFLVWRMSILLRKEFSARHLSRLDFHLSLFHEEKISLQISSHLTQTFRTNSKWRFTLAILSNRIPYRRLWNFTRMSLILAFRYFSFHTFHTLMKIAHAGHATMKSSWPKH